MLLPCPEVTAQLLHIKSLQANLNQGLDYLSQNNGIKLNEKCDLLNDIYKIRKALSILIERLEEGLCPSIKTSNYIIDTENDETEERKIEMDFRNVLTKAKDFYHKHGIELSADFEKKAKDIWVQNYEEIKNEIATYGYDRILIIPDNLPGLEQLSQQMTERYIKIHKGAGFKNRGSFANVRNSKMKTNIFRLVLVHDAEDIGRDILLSRTLNKYPSGITGYTQWEMEEIIAEENDLKVEMALRKICFGATPETSNDLLKSEGLSLDEYLIFLCQHFDETGRLLDSYHANLLLGSFSKLDRLKSPLIIVDTKSFEAFGQHSFNVYNEDLQSLRRGRGIRPCRSFFLKDNDGMKNDKRGVAKKRGWKNLPWRSV